MFKIDDIILRATTREDMHRQWEVENDPEMWFLDGGAPMPAKLETILGYYDEGVKNPSQTSVTFAIEVDGTYIGKCGLHDIQRVHHRCSLSIEISDRNYWSKGYGRKIVSFLVSYAFDHFNLHKVWLQTHSENRRAIRCYEAAGFVEEGRLRQHLWLNGRYVDRVMMGIFREDHKKNEQDL